MQKKSEATCNRFPRLILRQATPSDILGAPRDEGKAPAKEVGNGNGDGRHHGDSNRPTVYGPR